MNLRKITSAALACALAIAACGSSPSRPPSASSSGVPGTSQTPSTGTPSPAPGRTAGQATATLPVHGSARDLGEQILTAAAPDGGVFVSIPQAGGSVLALLDESGSPRPGWPITVEGTTTCPGLFAADDGSVRLVCTTIEPGLEPIDLSPLTAYAFDSQAAPLTGWPVELDCCFVTQRLVGETLTLLAWPAVGQPFVVRLVTVGRDGAVQAGAETAIDDPCCSWSIGPDGVAYGTARVSGLDGETPERSHLVMVRPSGPTIEPVEFPGLAAMPAFATDGRVLVTIGSLVRPITQVHAFEAGSGRLLGTSPELETVTASYGDTGGCDLENPTPPLVARDGTIYVLNWAARVFALDPSLQLRQGWPNATATPLALRDARYIREDAFCPSPALPATGPDGTLYLPLEEAPGDSGGSILALVPDGRVRDGWPVTIRRANGEFWSVTAAPDGTTYALAVELESATTSSATIVAIGPDSTVLFSTTMVDP